MMEHAEEFIPMAETDEASYRNYLCEFEEKVWPIFERYGYTKDTALLMWTLEKIRMGIQAIQEDMGAL